MTISVERWKNFELVELICWLWSNLYCACACEEKGRQKVKSCWIQNFITSSKVWLHGYLLAQLWLCAFYCYNFLDSNAKMKVQELSYNFWLTSFGTLKIPIGLLCVIPNNITWKSTDIISMDFYFAIVVSTIHFLSCYLIKKCSSELSYWFLCMKNLTMFVTP